MNKKQWLGLGLVAVAAVGLAACGNRIFQKITVSLTSNQQVKLTTLTTCNKRLEVTT